MELLLIDIGNTATKWCTAKAGVLGDLHREQDSACSDPSARWQRIAASTNATQAWLCASGNGADQCIEYLEGKGIQCHTIDNEGPLPIALNYQLPQRLGKDRIAAACGAWTLCHKPCVVVDAGTCITIDYININGTFSGGYILPGIAMQLQAMHEHTAALPAIDLTLEPTPSLPAQNTRDAMLWGVLHEVAEAVKGIRHIFANHENSDNANNAENTPLLLTGGYAPILLPLLNDEPQFQHHPQLLMLGLQAIAAFSECHAQMQQ